MMAEKKLFLISTVACLLLGAAVASSKCRTQVPKDAFVYAVGSSTLGSPLSNQLDTALKKEGFRFRKWAKASSGLARPDFHDWPARMPEIVKEWSPDVFVVSLGTNDYQALFHNKKWIKHSDKERWINTYSKRVDRLLALAAGKKKQRMVVWVGPVPFNTPKGRNLSLRINRILKDRIKAFDGHAVFIDMRQKLMAKGRPISTFRDQRGKARKTYRDDNVHLTIAAVKHLMTRRIVESITACRKQ